MYKAINRQTQEEVIILSQKYAGQIEVLRDLDRLDILVCQGCHQPVRVKAGFERRHHFAHKHKQSCSFGSESTEILDARAVLYEWLVTKYPTGVTIEKRIEDSSLPRPIDCWVEVGTNRFAYWIFDGGMKPSTREEITSAFHQLKCSVTWVFVESMLRADETDPDHINLSTTEREFIHHSEYDEVAGEKGSIFGKTIHYLLAEAGKLVTYRNLVVIHLPGTYEGNIQITAMGYVKLSPKTGEFVNPGEYEALSQLREERKEEEHRQKELASRRPARQEHRPASTTSSRSPYPAPDDS